MTAPSFSLVTAKDATPSRWILFLHGILGRGANWTTIARKLVHAHPDIGAALVDLRMHGASQSMAPPHTIDAAAADLDELALPGPVEGVLGHSFGGKVALAYLLRHPNTLSHVWIVDSNPGVRSETTGSESTRAIVDLLLRFPAKFATRDEFVGRLREAGYSEPIAQWLAMNLARESEGFAFRLDLTAIRALLDDYFARDLWSVLEHPPGRARIDAIVGGRSPVWSEADRERLARLDGVVTHVIPDAGHWVHAEAPDAVVAILNTSLDAR